MASLDSIRAPERTTPVVADASAQNQLGRDAFLKIFLAQLEAQDPLSPQDSSQLSAQLAQFSQLEQSVLGTEQLKAIAGKLDQLLEASAPSGGAALDPVSLIGRRIDFAADELALTSSGDSAPLGLPLPSAGEHGALLIEVEELGTGKRGLLTLVGGRDAQGDLQNLPAGEYRVRMQGGVPQLEGPAEAGDLDARATPFLRLTLSTSGQAALAEPQEEFRFAAGQRYRFSARAVPSAGGAPLELDLARTASVSAVRMREGRAYVIADGVEIDPARIQAVRQ